MKRTLLPGKPLFQTGIVPLAAQPVTSAWNGAPLLLDPGQSAAMASAPNGSAIFTAENMATMNNAGAVKVDSGGIVTMNLDPNTETPVFLIRNWKALPLTITNISPQPETPVRVQLIGQGLSGTNPLKLPTDGTALPMVSGACATAALPPRLMQLVLQALSGEMSTVAVIGGPRDPAGNNAYVFGLNFGEDTEWNTPYPPPPGYYKTTAGNTIYYQINWKAAGLLFCANLSSAFANLDQPLTAVVRRL